MKHHFENLQDRFRKKQIQEEKQKQEKNAEESKQVNTETQNMFRVYSRNTTEILIAV